MKLSHLLSIFSLSVCLVQTSVAETPDQKTTSQRFKDWESICIERDSAKQCRASQTLVNQQGQTVAVLNWYKPENDSSVTEIAVPLMIDLKQGVALSIDGGDALKREVNFCNNVACFVVLENDDQLLQSFRQGTQGLIAFKPITNQQTTLGFSLNGFSAAFGSLD